MMDTARAAASIQGETEDRSTWTPDAQRAPEGAAIELIGVTKVFMKGPERVEVFSAVSMQICAGEFVAIMGPSGSGKSTLLNLIGGLDRPSAGSVLVNDQQVASLGESALADWRARAIGFVFQSFNLIPVLSARENVELPLLARPTRRAVRRRRVDAAIRLVDLQDRERHFPSELSGGQQQRVAVARAIVSDPSLILCDEPTGNLDAVASQSLLGLLRDLNTRFGKTIVMVTHDPNAAAYASRVLHLEKGKFVERKPAT